MQNSRYLNVIPRLLLNGSIVPRGKFRSNVKVVCCNLDGAIQDCLLYEASVYPFSWRYQTAPRCNYRWAFVVDGWRKSRLKSKVFLKKIKTNEPLMKWRNFEMCTKKALFGRGYDKNGSYTKSFY